MQKLKAKKFLWIAAACVVILAIVLPIYLLQQGQETTEEGKVVDSSYITEIHQRLDPADIPELKSIISSSAANYTRERAVLVLADIAMSSGVTQDVVDFLKDVAYNEQNDEVRTAAYASLAHIYELYPLEEKGNLTASSIGEIRQGGNITLILTAFSSVDVAEAKVAIERIVPIGAVEGEGIKVKPLSPMEFPLKAGESRETMFEVILGNEGEYSILCVLKLDLDRITIQTIEREYYLKVGKTSGRFEAL